MKKYISIILLLLVFVLSGCSKANDGGLVLRIYNWQDYIDDGRDESGNKIPDVNSVIDDWIIDYKERTGKDVEVVYDTFETNEVMLNTLKTGKTSYDLVCPSEYTIQKMIREDMVEEYDISNGELTYVPNFNQYASPYLKKIFQENNLTKYAVPYMWGTLGLIYNPEYVSEEDVKTWAVMWNEEYKNQASAKDSVRDTYVVGTMYYYREELMALKDDFEEGKISVDEYNNKLSQYMNDTNNIPEIEKVLKEMKKNVFGFEVDSGKNDIVTGKIYINVAWSGDAVYSMDVAEEEEDVILNYSVPDEGSNIWFDGWVMPKGANKELAQDFVNFLSNPEIAARNMEYIGYTTAIAGDEIFELVDEWYGESDGEAVDLSYFFGDTISSEYLTDGKAIVYVGERGRQFDAQFPSEEIINRCAIMEDFKDKNDEVLAMWENVKLGDFSIGITIGVAVTIVVVIGGFYYIKFMNERKRRNRKLNWQ